MAQKSPKKYESLEDVLQQFIYLACFYSYKKILVFIQIKYLYQNMFNQPQLDYRSVVEFASQLVHCLFFFLLLYVSVIHLWPSSPQYCVKVVRSPDGYSRYVFR